MHLVESYALNTGLKIQKPYIYEAYIPTKCKGKYISFQPFSAADARKYQNWEEVIEILAPVLEEHEISIVQLGVPQEPLIKGCEDLRGLTSFNQAAYVIKNSILHLGGDSFGVHFASGYQKKIVALYSALLPSNSGPYWSKDEDIITLEPPRENGERPSYAAVEIPREVDKIMPEEIAHAICKLLNLDFEYGYKTLHFGDEYIAKKVELIPHGFLTNWRDLLVDSLIVRMDKLFNQEVLVKQLQLCKCSVVTDRPVDLDVLSHFKDQVLEYVYYVDKDTNPDYFLEMRKRGLKFLLLTKLPEKEFNKIKLKYLDVGTVYAKRDSKKEDIEDKIKDKDLKRLYYRSGRYCVNGQALYPCYSEISRNNPVTKVRFNDPLPLPDDPDFWADLSSMIILEKTS